MKEKRESEQWEEGTCSASEPRCGPEHSSHLGKAASSPASLGTEGRGPPPAHSPAPLPSWTKQLMIYVETDEWLLKSLEKFGPSLGPSFSRCPKQPQTELEGGAEA